MPSPGLEGEHGQDHRRHAGLITEQSSDMIDIDQMKHPELEPCIDFDKGCPHKILMLVHDRPIYAYMTLDSLRRATYSPYCLTVIHHRPKAGLADNVLRAFQRRKTISNIVEMRGEFVDWPLLTRIGRDSLDANDEFIFFIEDDVIIEKSQTCWLATMADAMHKDPKLALLGSAIDKSDFIDPEALSSELGRPLTEDETAIIKVRSPERSQTFELGEELTNSHNVAGRLFCLRLSALVDDLVNIDSRMDSRLRSEGWKTAVMKSVRHRHMSLQNYYDYPGYYQDRNKHVDHLSR